MSIVSIVLEMQKREDNEIATHFIHDIKAKGYDVTALMCATQKLIKCTKKDNSIGSPLYRLLQCHD